MSTLTASAAGDAAGLLACAVIGVESAGLVSKKPENTEEITNLVLATGKGQTVDLNTLRPRLRVAER